MTAIYSFLHLLVDGICALAMFGRFVNNGQGQLCFLLYNFCAFALQMPLGVWLDSLHLRSRDKGKDFSFGFAVLGVGVTLLGMVSHPVILGIGNALFHIGGGVGTIGEDDARNRKGRGLGVFVAPGALGLYLGKVLAKAGYGSIGALGASILAVFAVWVACVLHKKFTCERSVCDSLCGQGMRPDKGSVILGISCFLVVILRSYIGMAVTFSWKQVPVWGCISVLAVVCGKVAGGFLAARLGYVWTTMITLAIAAIGYWYLELVPMGLLALFVFNMTMPMTLYLLIKVLPDLPGFSFGLLTFGLFLGFLPIYLGEQSVLNGPWLGALGSILSMGILLLGIWQGGKHVSD